MNSIVIYGEYLEAADLLQPPGEGTKHVACKSCCPHRSAMCWFVNMMTFVEIENLPMHSEFITFGQSEMFKGRVCSVTKTLNRLHVP